MVVLTHHDFCTWVSIITSLTLPTSQSPAVSDNQQSSVTRWKHSPFCPRRPGCQWSLLGWRCQQWVRYPRAHPPTCRAATESSSSCSRASSPRRCSLTDWEGRREEVVSTGSDKKKLRVCVLLLQKLSWRKKRVGLSLISLINWFLKCFGF